MTRLYEKMAEKQYTTREALKDGKTLLAIKHDFLLVRTTQTAKILLNILHDSVVYVPITIEKNQNKSFLLSPNEEEPNKGLNFKPLLLRNKGKFYFPMFSNEEQITPSFKETTTTIYMPVVECIKMAKQLDNIAGLVLDPQSEVLEIPFEIADAIMSAEGALKPEK